MQSNRLASGGRIDRRAPLKFLFDGKPIHGFEGDTVASALLGNGVTLVGRSFKYHRPRGLLCVSGRCPSCLMNVDGAPSIRACTETVREGMEVRHQNAWPSLRFDVFSILDKLDPPPVQTIISCLLYTSPSPRDRG